MDITNDQLQQLKRIELAMLDEFVRICDANGIDYFLSGGTCLGAARHKGFIPWDDDIDVGMLREDYDRFAQACKTELSDGFIFQDMNTEPNCGLVFGKIRKKGTVYSETYSSHIAMSQAYGLIFSPMIEFRTIRPNALNNIVRFRSSRTYISSNVDISFLKIRAEYKRLPIMWQRPCVSSFPNTGLSV